MNDRLKEQAFLQEEKQLIIHSMQEAPDIIHVDFPHTEAERRTFMYKDYMWYRIVRDQFDTDQAIITYVNVTMSELDAIGRVRV